VKWFCILFLLPFGLLSQDYPLELRIQAGHANKVTVVKFSPDGKFLASGSYDRNVILWDVKTGRELRRYQTAGYPITLDISTDGSLILTNSDQGVTQLWEIQTGKLVKQLGGKDLHIKVAKFLPGSKQFITAGGSNTAQIWSLSQSEPTKTFDGDRLACSKNCQRAIDISTDGKLMLSGNSRGQITLWDINSQLTLRKFKYYPNNRHSSSSSLLVQFLPDSQSFLSASEDEGILWWSVEENEAPINVLLEPQIVSSGLKFMLTDLDVNRNMTIAAVLFQEGIQGSFNRKNNFGLHLFDLQANKLKQSFDIGEFNNFLSLDFSPSEDSIVVSNHTIPQLYDFDSGLFYHDFTGHLVKHIAPYWIMKATKKHLLVPGTEIVIERVGNNIFGWNLRTGRVINSFPSHQKLVIGMALNRDASRLATGGEDNMIKVSHLESGKIIWEKETSRPVFALTFSNDGKFLVSAHLSGMVMLWDAQTGEYIKHISQGSGQWYQTPLSLDFTSSGLLSWGNHLVDLETGKKIVEFTGHEDRVHDVKVTSDGKSMLTTGWDGKVLLRELYYGGKVISLEGHRGAVYCSAWNPDENKIATGGTDNTIRIWNKNGVFQFELKGHTAPVVSVSYSDDADYLISGSMDGSVKVWDLEARRELYTHIMLDDDKWMVKVPSGHFYATTEVRESIFFVRGTKSYKLDQFFEEFFQPGLIINLLGEEYKSRSNINNIISQLPPPKIDIVFPSNGNADRKTVEIFVRVKNEGGGINEIKVMQNGKRIIEDRSIERTNQGAIVAKSYKIDLVPGSNFIEATAFSDGRIESEKSQIKLLRPADEPSATCYILSIGINKYKNPRLNLNYAVADATGIASLIEDGSKKLFTRVETHLITDDQATKENILLKLKSLAEKVKPTDVFYFFYAGHGSTVNDNFYFIPTNSVRLYEEESLKRTAIYAGELTNYFKNIRALKQVILIDACHSGGSTALLATRGAAEEKALAQLSRSAGVHVMAAAGSDQTATEYTQLGHGLFTYLVMEALKGKADGAPADNKVTVYELKSFIDDQVPEYSLRFRNVPQYPNTFSLGHDFPIVLN